MIANICLIVVIVFNLVSTFLNIRAYLDLKRFYKKYFGVVNIKRSSQIEANKMAEYMEKITK